MLRRPRADRRNLPTGAEAPVARTTSEAGGMMIGPSLRPSRSWFLFGRRVTDLCPNRRNPQEMGVSRRHQGQIHRQSSANATLVRQRRLSCAHRRRQRPPQTVFYPRGQHQAPRGFVLPRFVNAHRPHPAASVTQRPTSKIQASRPSASPSRRLGGL